MERKIADYHYCSCGMKMKKSLHNSKVIQFRRFQRILRQRRIKTTKREREREKSQGIERESTEKNFMNKIEIFILDKFKVVV